LYCYQRGSVNLEKVKNKSKNLENYISRRTYTKTHFFLPGQLSETLDKLPLLLLLWLPCRDQLYPAALQQTVSREIPAENSKPIVKYKTTQMKEFQF